MKKNFFEKNFPSIDYIIKRWPYSRHILEKYIISSYKKPDLFGLSMACLENVNHKNKKNISSCLRKISKICSKNTFNNYHNDHHTKSVVLLSAIIGKILRINSNDFFLLIILALAHDINHQGSKIINKPYYQEKKSFLDLKRIIFKRIVSFNDLKRIKKIILNTYFPKKVNTTDDLLEKILLDTDLLVSLMLPIDFAYKQSLKIKSEMKISQTHSKQLFLNFFNLCINKKLNLSFSKNLLRRNK